MCEPATALAIAGTVASAAGTYMQTREAGKNAKRVQEAKNRAFASGMERQSEYANEASAAFQPAIQKQGGEGFNDQLDASTTERLNAFNDARIGNADYSVATPNAPKNVIMAREQAFNEADAEGDRDTTNLARLGGYGDSMFKTGLERNEYARAFGNLSDKASRDSNLIQLDMSAAGNNASKPGSLFPTLLKTGGSAATMYGAAGAPGFDKVFGTSLPTAPAGGFKAGGFGGLY